MRLTKKNKQSNLFFSFVPIFFFYPIEYQPKAFSTSLKLN